MPDVTADSVPTVPAVLAAMEATWPPAAVTRVGPWTIRDGRGGGKRVSAATAETGVTPADIAQAEAAMRALGQDPLFQIRPGDVDQGLDAALDARGYRVIDPVALYLGPIAKLAVEPPHVSAMTIWPPLQAQLDLWATAGIGPERIAVMHRATGPRTTVIGRSVDRFAGTAFVACAEEIAMLHALEVDPRLRRQGTANNMLRRAACWAQDHGANWLGLAVTEANAPARNLYASLKMEVVGHYHYRVS